MTEDRPVTQEQIATLEQTVETLVENVETIVDILTQRPGGPWSWELLEDEARVQLWDQLFTFVKWLDHRYLQFVDREKYAVTECWYEHPVAVESLTALMVAHQAVYQESATIASSALVDWHERCLWPTMDRLKSLNLFKLCDKGHALGRREPLPHSREKFDEFLVGHLEVIQSERDSAAGQPSAD